MTLVAIRPLSASERDRIRRLYSDHLRAVLPDPADAEPTGWCLHCDGELPVGRRKFCSDSCTEAYWEICRERTA